MQTTSDNMQSTVQSVLEPASSPAMQIVLRTLEHIAASDLSALIVGESGTGKEWLGRRIHFLSVRADRKFVPISCTAPLVENVEREILGCETHTASAIEVKRGAIDEASGGTLFLDDLSSLPVAVQAQVASALEHQKIRRPGGYQEVPVDVRLIATLDRHPEILIADGILRKDIYYRVNPVIIELPPLRERREDIPLLIEKFIVQSNSRHGGRVSCMSAEALRVCLEHHWPGNIRELKNAVEYAVVMARTGQIVPENLPRCMAAEHRTAAPGVAAAAPIPQNTMNVASVEKILIEQALSESRTKKQAAKLLGISLKTLYNKLNRYDLYEKFVNDPRHRQTMSQRGEKSQPSLQSHGDVSVTVRAKPGSLPLRDRSFVRPTPEEAGNA